MLRTLPESYKSHWKDHLNKVVHAYNCTQHESTGYSPFYLIFGRHPHLPIDLVCNLKPLVENKSYPKYVAYWQSAMKEAYSIAASKCKAQGDKAKAFYDLKVRSSTLLPGDHVLIKNLSEHGGPGKLRSYWEDKVHVVVHRKSPDSPVYQLKPENGTGPIRTLHHNLLFPCGSLLESSSTPRQASPGQQELKPSTTLSKRKSQRSSKSTHPTRPSPEITEQSDDEEDSDFVLVHENVPQPTSSSVLSLFAPAFKIVPEPPEEPTTEHAALIENPSQAMLEIPPHSPIPDQPSNNFGNSALADGGPVQLTLLHLQQTQHSLCKTKNVLSEWNQSSQTTLYQVHQLNIHLSQILCVHSEFANLHHVLRIICLEIQFTAIKTLLRYRISEQTTLQIMIELLVSLHSGIKSGCHLKIFQHITIILTYLNNHFR